MDGGKVTEKSANFAAPVPRSCASRLPNHFNRRWPQMAADIEAAGLKLKIGI
jgi:hypothetical protein